MGEGPFSVQVNRVWSGGLATFTDGTPQRHYTEQVNWGDGSPIDTSDVFITDPAPYQVVGGSHAYKAVGTYTATITVKDDKGRSASATDEFIVTDGPTPLVSDRGVDVRWVGGRDSVQAGAPDADPGHAIQTQTWTYTGDPLYLGQTHKSDLDFTTYLFNTPVGDFNNLVNGHGSFCYGATPGLATFRVDVVYQDNSKGTNFLKVNVRKPTMQVTLGGTLVDTPQALPNIVTENGQTDFQLGSLKADGNPTIVFKVESRSPDFKGSMAVQQVITAATNQYVTPEGTFSSLHRIVNNQLRPAKFNLIDPSPDFYNGEIENTKIDLDDTPHMPVKDEAIKLTLKAEFSDTAMIQGTSDGIWVPDQNWTWSLDISGAKNNGAWTLTNNTVGKSTTDPIPTIAHPTWKSSANLYTKYVAI